jgi:CheY-like chemotaxis protein
MTDPNQNAQKSILVVDDNEANLNLLVLMLQRLGCAVSSARNGRDALDRLTEGNFDLVVLDLQMPDIDGFEAARRIRDENSSVANRKVPILAVTAHASDYYKRLCFDAGMDAFLPKPVRMADLSTVVNRWTIPGVCDSCPS